METKRNNSPLIASYNLSFHLWQLGRLHYKRPEALRPHLTMGLPFFRDDPSLGFSVISDSSTTPPKSQDPRKNPEKFAKTALSARSPSGG